MYEAYYGLKERPFDLSPDPRFLFLSKGHREALLHLRYGLSGRPGLTVLVGEAGTGKTTLVRAALQSIGGGASTVVHLSNPTLTRAEFYEYLAKGFGFDPAATASKTVFLRELELGLARQAEGAVLALIVDEAQILPHELLEEVRLLTNTEVAGGRAMAVALVGQPELAARLAEPRLRQLKQRVALRCELGPLSLGETAAYISARLRVAGGIPEALFTRDAVSTVYEYSRGIPRTVSVLCDNALVNGLALDAKPVGRSVILEVCQDFDLGQATWLARESSRATAANAPPPTALGGARATSSPPQGRTSGGRSMFGLFGRRHLSIY
jgi:type II secretory pathway predicted ATPase ExeA